MLRNIRKFNIFYKFTILLVFVMLCSCLHAQEVYFASSYFSNANNPYHLDMMNFYKYDKFSDDIVLYKSVELDNDIVSVRSYPSIRSLIVTTGLFLPSKFYFFPFDSINSYHTINTSDNKLISNYRIHSESDKINLKLNILNASSRQISSINLPVKIKSTNSKSHSNSVSNLIVSGFGTSYGSNNDIISCQIDSLGILRTMNNEFNLIEYQVDLSVVKTKNAYSWIIAYTDKDWMLMVPTHNEHSDQRELLVLDKKSNKWKSIFIKGAASAPSKFNNWLSGEIKHANPDNDYKNRQGGAPIETDEIFLYNLDSHEYFNVVLGKNRELLLIDNENNIFYRLGNELYSAKVNNGSIENNKLIISADYVSYIHWAFRGDLGK